MYSIMYSICVFKKSLLKIPYLQCHWALTWPARDLLLSSRLLSVRNLSPSCCSARIQERNHGQVTREPSGAVNKVFWGIIKKKNAHILHIRSSCKKWYCMICHRWLYNYFNTLAPDGWGSGERKGLNNYWGWQWRRPVEMPCTVIVQVHVKGFFAFWCWCCHALIVTRTDVDVK